MNCKVKFYVTAEEEGYIIYMDTRDTKERKSKRWNFKDNNKQQKYLFGSKKITKVKWDNC